MNKISQPLQEENSISNEYYYDSLSRIVPVIYGAVLSYTMYVLAQLVNRYLIFLADPTENMSHHYHEYLMPIILYILFTMFMVVDVGSVIRYGDIFPYKSSGRYIYEVIIACFYVMSYAMLLENSIMSLLSFAFVIVWGAPWCNQLKQEYLDDKSNIDDYMRTKRDLHYIGGMLLVILTSLFIFIKKEFFLSISCVHSFGTLFLIWFVFFDLYSANRHKDVEHKFGLYLFSKRSSEN